MLDKTGSNGETGMVRLPAYVKIVHDLPKRFRVKIAWLGPKTGDKTYLTSALESVSGVSHVKVNLVAGSIVVNHDGKKASRDRALRRIAMFEAHEGPHPQNDAEGRHLFHMTVNALALAASPLMPMQMQTAVMASAVTPTILQGVRSLLTKGITVDVLDALAVGMAAARGQWYTALSTNFLIHLGEQLEDWTNNTSTDLLRQLLHPTPSTVWVEKDGQLIEISSGEIQVNDVLAIGPGETVPVDGQVVSGTALINESSVTGESVPVRKEVQSRVLSGTVVEDGNVRIRAVLVGEDTTTARISKFIKESLETKSDTQIRAEKEANQRIKITLGLGALTYLITRDLQRVASVFLVDYSCALKLGTPVAMKSAMYQGAKHGILVKGGSAIERLAAVDTVIFDKTGTLTYGELDVVEVKSVAPKAWPQKDLLALVASIEEHSTHPVADAVVSHARSEELAHVSHSDVQFIVAHGLVSEVDGKRVVIGSRHFLEEHEHIKTGRKKKQIERMEEDGQILLYAAVDGKLVGILGMRDRLRPEAKDILVRLRETGVKNIAILTGDRKHKADALAAELGVDEVFAELRPEEKAGIVTKLREEGRKVAFVGDGVNDAPALLNADVGVAMPQGADIARACADIILMDDHIEGVSAARSLSKSTMDLIGSNFKWAVGVNSGLFLGASMGWTSPVVSSLLHNGTTLGTLVRALIGTKWRQ